MNFDLYKKPNLTDTDTTKACEFLAKNDMPICGYLDIVENCNKEQDNTYNIKTGKVVVFKSGYMVSFQINGSDGKRYKYTSKEYDELVYDCVLRTGSIPYLGVFGSPEISFWTEKMSLASEIAKDYNQHSVYDFEECDIVPNKNYDDSKNPMGSE